jgi:hypothetical protein
VWNTAAYFNTTAVVVCMLMQLPGGLAPCIQISKQRKRPLPRRNVFLQSSRLFCQFSAFSSFPSSSNTLLFVAETFIWSGVNLGHKEASTYAQKYIRDKILCLGPQRIFFPTFSVFRSSVAGLPDFSWYMIPKQEKCTKWIQNEPNGHKISLISMKCFN